MKTKDDEFSGPKETARFACDAPASPARVRSLAKMIEESLTGILGRPPADHEFTLVVSNLDMSAKLRAHTPEAADAGRALERIARDPTLLRRLPAGRRAPVAKALRQGLEAFKDTDFVIQDGSKRHATRADAILIGALRGIESEPVAPLVLRGTTETVTPILGVMRRVDGSTRLLARLRVESAIREVPLDDSVVDLAIEAVKRSCEVRASVDAVWESAEGDDFSLNSAKSVITGVVLLESVLAGDELLAAFGKIIDADAADAAARMVYEERGIDWQELQ